MVKRQKIPLAQAIFRLARLCAYVFGLNLLLAVPTSYAAQTLDAQTQYEMGSAYRKGIGVTADSDLALKWYRKAAEQGLAKGEYAVAWMLAFENEAQNDYVAALPWLLRASGPHKTPQGSAYAEIKNKAERRLKWMCKKGVVDFPASHPLSKDSKCWLARGNRFFYGRDRLGELAGLRNYHVERDYVRARTLLEKALAAGEKSAAINLANIYKDGLGTPPDDAKFEHYLQIAGETNNGRVNFFLAERAEKNMDIETYIRRLKIAATDEHTRAARQLGKVYFEGDLTDKDFETAFTYFFLGERESYFLDRRARRKGGRLPGENADMLEFLRRDTALQILDRAKTRADAFAMTHDFRDSTLEKIERSYRNAVSDLNWIAEGNDTRWYRDRGWTIFYIFGFIFLGYFIFSLGFKFLLRR